MKSKNEEQLASFEPSDTLSLETLEKRVERLEEVIKLHNL